jgi:hypothetical protein
LWRFAIVRAEMESIRQKWSKKFQKTSGNPAKNRWIPVQNGVILPLKAGVISWGRKNVQKKFKKLLTLCVDLLGCPSRRNTG